jgi:uncharacterized protein
MTTWLRLGVAVALCASAGWAVDWKSLKPQGYVSDFAGVIDGGSKGRLEAYCAGVERATGVKLALVTVASLEGEPLEDVANALAGGWQQHGLLFLLAVRERRQHLIAGPGLDWVSRHRSLLNEMRPALRRQQYSEALMAVAETLGTTLASARHTTLDVSLPRTLRPTFGDALPWPLVAGSVGVLAWLAFAARHHRFIGNGIERATFGCRGNGGFGGYDSGDKGSAFGGSAASSDW